MTEQHDSQKSTLHDWIKQQGGSEISKHHIARAIGKNISATEQLLNEPVTLENLLLLNQLVQYRHLTLANRVWPRRIRPDWREKRDQWNPVLKLIFETLGLQLMRHVDTTYGKDVVFDYWTDLRLPAEFSDIDEDAISQSPDSHVVENPHINDDYDEVFFFGNAATAACFAWLIDSRNNYSHYVDNRTSYLNDPLGIRLAYDLRDTLLESYWATLPPDTLISYLAIARALQAATVPAEYQEGRLPPLKMVHAARVETNHLAVIQVGQNSIWSDEQDDLTFDKAGVNIFVLDAQIDRSPAAIILTTGDEAGNPEQHRRSFTRRYLTNSESTLALLFTSRKSAVFDEAEDILSDVLNNVLYGVHQDSGAFCISRSNPFFGEVPENLISMYKISGGYMLQLDPRYEFSPQEMDID